MFCELFSKAFIPHYLKAITHANTHQHTHTQETTSEPLLKKRRITAAHLTQSRAHIDIVSTSASPAVSLAQVQTTSQRNTVISLTQLNAKRLSNQRMCAL